jgi:hypothetical protein
MRLVLIITLVFILGIINSCRLDDPNKDNSNTHKVVVTEVLNAGEYTYLKVKEDDMEQWLAVNAMEAKPGEIYYYEGGLEMTNFKSKELKRTFESVLFLESLSKVPVISKGVKTMKGDLNEKLTTSGAVTIEKKNLKIDHTEGCITIADLFSGKASYSGKTVRVKAQVIKFSRDIMKKNWIHVQDGTESGGKFDLVVTTNEVFTQDDIVTLEGKITVDKDFGYGYFYEILMEDAKSVK